MRTERSRGFTLIEVLIAGGLTLILLITVVLAARHFMVNLIWSGETFSGLTEAALIESMIRRDLTRTSLAQDRSGLSAEISAGKLRVSCPSDGSPASVEYQLDATTRMLMRSVDGQPAKPVGQGMVRAFDVTPVFVIVQPDGRREVTRKVPSGQVPDRAGFRVRFVLQGQEVGGSGGPVNTVDITTHVFPVFANLGLSSVWRRP